MIYIDPRIITCKHCGAKYNRESVQVCPLCFSGKDIVYARKILNSGKKYNKKGYQKKIIKTPKRMTYQDAYEQVEEDLNNF